MRRHLRWLKAWPSRDTASWPHPDGMPFIRGYSFTYQDNTEPGIRQQLWSPRPWIGRVYLRNQKSPSQSYHATTLAIIDDSGPWLRFKVFWQGSFVYLLSNVLEPDEPDPARYHLKDFDRDALDPPIPLVGDLTHDDAGISQPFPFWVDRPYRRGRWNSWRMGMGHVVRDATTPFFVSITVQIEFHHINGCDAAIQDEWLTGQSPPGGLKIDPITPAQESALIAALQAEGFDFDEADLFYDTPPSD